MRIYNSTIPPMTLTSQLNAAATTISLSYSGLPVVTAPDTLTLVVDPDTANEEIVTVTAHSSGSSTATITRGSESTADITHTNGAVVKHMVTARDLQEPHKHINAKNYSTNGSVLLHGLGSSDGDVVGTDAAQTLKYKTLSTGCVVPEANVTGLTAALASKATLAAPTFTGSVVLPSTTTIGSVDGTEIGYLNGVTSGIQSQIDTISTGLSTANTDIDTLTLDVSDLTSDVATLQSDVAAIVPGTTVQSGFVSITYNSGTGSATVTTATTSTLSIIVATAASTTFVVAVTNIGTNTFTLGVKSVDGSTASGNVIVRWMVI